MAAAQSTTGKATKELLSALVDQHPHPVLAFGPDGTPRYWNRAAEQWARRDGPSLFEASLPPEMEAAVAQCAKSRAPASVELELLDHTFSLLLWPGPEEGWVCGTLVDVTDRLVLERQVRLAQRADLAGQFSVGLARDITNVMTVIQGQVGLLRGERELTPAMEESLRAVALAAQRASKLTRQLIDFSLPGPFRASQFDLNELVTRLSPLLSRCLGEDIRFRFEYEPELPLLQGDVPLIEQTVLNLMVNARQAMPRGGQVTLQTTLVDVRRGDAGRRPGLFACLTVSDTGQGMDSGVQSRLFEPFFTTNDHGAGLGLAVVHGIVERHGGWIEVYSQPGQGSTFKVFLPARALKEELTPEGPEAPSGAETVLVVEDEPAVRATFRYILERHGYTVLEAANSVEALAVWHRHHPQVALLLTDVVLPSGLTGEELAERFKAQKPELRVIYASGYSKTTAGRDPASLVHGAFLEKPFDAETLARLVRDCLDGAASEP